jgi:hypothetical protein
MFLIKSQIFKSLIKITSPTNTINWWGMKTLKIKNSIFQIKLQ